MEAVETEPPNTGQIPQRPESKLTVPFPETLKRMIAYFQRRLLS